MTEEEKQGFCCPEIVPPNAPDDFCIPEACCPPRLPQFKFPSPTTCLPEEILEDLELRIRKANQFLLDVALSDDEDQNEAMRKAFEGLVGQRVKVFLECEEAAEDVAEEEEQSGGVVEGRVEGRVMLAGRDFTLLQNKQEKILVPHENIIKIKLSNRFAEPFDEETLRDIDPCFRRCLTFRFGEVVSNSPELIHIFFKITLKVFLLQFIDCKIKLVGDETVEGSLFTVDDESITICVDDDKKIVPLGEALYFKVFD